MNEEGIIYVVSIVHRTRSLWVPRTDGTMIFTTELQAKEYINEYRACLPPKIALEYRFILHKAKTITRDVLV